MTSVHSWWFIFINLEKQDGPSFLTFKKNAVLLIFGFAGSSLLLMGFLPVVVSGGYSSLQCTGLSLQWLLLLWSIGTWAHWLQLAGSGAWAQWLWHMCFSCSEACDIFPDQGLNPCPLHLKVHSYPLYHWGSTKNEILKHLPWLSFQYSPLNKSCSIFSTFPFPHSLSLIQDVLTFYSYVRYRSECLGVEE